MSWSTLSGSPGTSWQRTGEAAMTKAGGMKPCSAILWHKTKDMGPMPTDCGKASVTSSVVGDRCAEHPYVATVVPRSPPEVRTSSASSASSSSGAQREAPSAADAGPATPGT